MLIFRQICFFLVLLSQFCTADTGYKPSNYSFLGSYIRIGIAEWMPSINGQQSKASPLIQETLLAFERAHINVVLVHYDQSWGLVMKDLRDGKIDASLWWKKTNLREREFIYSYNPVIKIESYLVALKSNPKASQLQKAGLSNTQDLSQYTLGNVTGNPVPNEVKSMKITLMKTKPDCFIGLESGKYDFVVSDITYAKEYFGSDNVIAIPLKAQEGYMLFSKRIDPNKVHMFQEILEENFGSEIIIE